MILKVETIKTKPALLQNIVKTILFGTSIEDKLTSLDNFEWGQSQSICKPKNPGRCDKIKFSDKKLKFPKNDSLAIDEKKAIALHSFANHELQAIEMMAAMILIIPHETLENKKIKQGIIASLIDEQKHFTLYQNRLKELGYDFGSFPVNDFFWKQMDKINDLPSYFALMSLTFEAANLDFAHYYKKIFNQLGDQKTSLLMDEVLLDEISHVKLGWHYIQKWRQQKSVWEYYNEILPWPITPARSKGIEYSEELRFKSGFDSDFVERLNHFDDDFLITKRNK